MSVTEAASAVRAAGYRSQAAGEATFRTMVNTALIKGPFRRKGWRKYTAKQS